MNTQQNTQEFKDPEKAVEHLQQLYDASIQTLRKAFTEHSHGNLEGLVTATYPEISINIARPSRTRNKQDSYGFMTQVGNYTTTITKPSLFKEYLVEQLSLIVKNHGEALIRIGYSDSPIPIHFAFDDDHHPEASLSAEQQESIPYHFHVPSALSGEIDNKIVDGHFDYSNGVRPLSFFSAARIDKSLGRISYYTGTKPDFFQRNICFTNYEEYIKKFRQMAKDLFSEDDNEAKKRLGLEASTTYLAFIEPGNVITFNDNIPNVHERFNQVSGNKPQRLPQMPGYHLIADNNSGISLVNIGVGPSNAANITDHLAVLRPDIFLMLGHCAGLTEDQRLGDYVLANAYSRRDGVLDRYVPVDTPIPALAEVQLALKQGIAKAIGVDAELDRSVIKDRYRTGTVVTESNRNWEEDHRTDLIKRFMMSRAVGLDMESATIAANGYRYRVPYGTLLCVSDKPLTGEIKMAGMVNNFYKQSVGEHFWSGIHALVELGQENSQRKHSRKLRSPFEPPFR